MLKNPTTYRASQKRRETAWIGHLDAIAEKARADQQAKQRREYRMQHPKKKQPRHVRLSQMNPLTRR